MRFLHLAFLLPLLTLPFGQVVRLQLPNNINASLFDICIIISGCIWIGYVVAGKTTDAKGFLSRPMLLFFLTILLSLIANAFRYSLTEFAVAALYALRWLFYGMMYFMVMELPHDFKKRIPDFLTVIGAVLLLLGYIQYFLYSNLRNLYYLGWDEHNYRMFSTFLDPNFFGAFLVLYLLFLLGRLSGKKMAFRSALLAGLAGVAFIGVFLTTSRSAMVMLVISMCTFLFLTGRKKFILLFFAVSLGILLLASPFYHIENVNPFRVTSSLARVESAENALEIISQNSIFGVGFNAYRYAQYEYGYRNSDTQYPSHADSGTDNSFLFVLATTGIIGFLSYGYLLYKIYILGKKERGVMGKVLIASLVSLAVNSLFINSLFFPFILYWMWVIAGLTDYT